MKAQITFDDKGGITIEGEEDAVKRAYEIWDPYKAGKRADHLAALEAVAETYKQGCIEIWRFAEKEIPDGPIKSGIWNILINHEAAILEAVKAQIEQDRALIKGE